MTRQASCVHDFTLYCTDCVFQCIFQVHRVPIPKDTSKKNIARQSISYFLAPDDEALIQPVVPKQDIKTNFEAVLTRDYYDARVDYNKNK